MRAMTFSVGLVAGLALFSLSALSAGGVAPLSTTFQIDAAHDGSIAFATPFAPPLKMKWSVDLGGPISYPVVDGGLVFVIAGEPTGTRLVALNIATGAIVWQKVFRGGVQASYLASDSGRIFLTTLFGPLQAFASSTGSILWSHALRGQAFYDFLPITAGGFVYTAGDGVGTDLYKVNELTGEVVWTKIFTAGGLGATFGNNEIYFPTPCYVPGLLASTGKLVWQYAIGCDGGGGQIGAFFAGLLYAADVNDVGGVIIDTHNGRLVGSFSGYAPTFYGASFYTISDSYIVGNNLTNGNIEWWFASNDTLSIPSIVINGNVYTLSDTGHLYINDGKNGRLLQSFSIGLGTVKTPLKAPSTGLGAGQNTLIVPSGSVLSAFAP